MSYFPAVNRGTRIVQTDFNSYVNVGSSTMVIYPIDVKSMDLQDGDSYEVRIWGKYVANANGKKVDVADNDALFVWGAPLVGGTSGNIGNGWVTTVRFTKITGSTYTYISYAAHEANEPEPKCGRTTSYNGLSDTHNISVTPSGGAADGDITILGMTTTLLKA